MPDVPGRARYRIDLQPVGRRAEITAGDTLLDAARTAGVELVALCGGEGWCHSCVVRLISGAVSEPSLAELDALAPEQLAAGYRLACQVTPFGDVRIDIPPESLTTPQRLNLEGREVALELAPVVTPRDVTLAEPTSHDLLADASRLAQACTARGEKPVTIAAEVLRDLSARLRELEWRCRAAIRRADPDAPGEIVAVLPPGARLFGLAVDLGTTKVAAYLVDLETGATVGKAGAMNPQIAYGEDVISRINHCLEHADGRATLQSGVVETLNTLTRQLCREVDAEQEQVVDAVVVGNTAMHHLFAGLPVEQLVRAPYIAAVSEPLDLRASDLRLACAPGARVHLPSNIAGFVGADHVAMALATRAWEEPERCIIALDIGTNTEVTLTWRGRSWCCSCASGPAFEGAHIEDGMRAAPGAIERIQFESARVYVKTIGDQPPVGICGSGIVDAVSELYRTGIIDKRGTFVNGNGNRYVLVPAGDTGHGREIVITRKDVNEVQLAKGAIRAGMEVLLQEAGATSADVDAFIIAGAFGSYLDIESCTGIRMFPQLPPERYQQVGNAAGAGARQLLLSGRRRATAAALSRQVTYVELTIHPGFLRHFLTELRLS